MLAAVRSNSTIFSSLTNNPHFYDNMKATIYDRLMRRELGTRSVYSSIGGMYGDRKWIKDLDIVNELDGHNGCVNALRYD